MNRSHLDNRLSRREFLRAGGGLGLAGLGLAASPSAFTAAPPASPARGYDVSRYETTDPRLIGYTEARRFRAPRPDARRFALGPDGRLWVAAGHYLVEVSGTGEVLREVALGGPVRCVTVAADGVVYAALRDHVEALDVQGQRQTAWEPPRARAWLTGLATTAGDLWVADSGNRVVWRYERTGRLCGAIVEKDPERGIPGLILPSPHLDVEWQPDGRLWINNSGRHLVECYSREGDRLTAWGRPGMGIEAFCGCCNPIALTLLPEGRSVTAEKGLPRVKVYEPDGRLVCVVAGVESFPENLRVARKDSCRDTLRVSLDVAADRAGQIYILDPVAADIRVMIPKAAT